MSAARNIGTVFKREFSGYFATPVAYVFLIVFLALAGAMTFFLGNFFQRNQADLDSFFVFHPWVYLFLMPAIAMRLWAEERKTGTVELLFTLPIATWHAVVGKFLAAWAFAGIALALTFPIWITVNYLGEPDNGSIVASTSRMSTTIGSSPSSSRSTGSMLGWSLTSPPAALSSSTSTGASRITPRASVARCF